MRVTGQPTTTFVQVLNPDGTPATAATVNYIIREGNQSETFEEGVMTHLANGIFYATWVAGGGRTNEWTVECYSGDPVFRQTFHYFIPSNYLSPMGGGATAFNVTMETTDTQKLIATLEYPATSQILMFMMDMRSFAQPKRLVIKTDFMFWNDGGKIAQIINFPDDFPTGVEHLTAIIQVSIKRISGLRQTHLKQVKFTYLVQFSLYNISLK
jgi:hypothetical protein